MNAADGRRDADLRIYWKYVFSARKQEQKVLGDNLIFLKVFMR